MQASALRREAQDAHRMARAEMVKLANGKRIARYKLGGIAT
jgi:hypothetical protein